MQVARTHFSLAELLDLAWLDNAIGRAPRRSGWDRLALTQLEDELAGVLRGLTRAAMQTEGDGTLPVAEAWARSSLRGLDRYRMMLGELKAARQVDLAMLSVAVRTLSELLRGR
jgi:glutamate dehydrogenase